MSQMTEEQRKQLEEMAKNQLVEKLVMDNCDTNYFESMFMSGAQAAFDMREGEMLRMLEEAAKRGGDLVAERANKQIAEAVKAERERCARLMAKNSAYFEDECMDIFHAEAE